jgi:UDP-N-acetylglucosamine diphosphorylase/glucosamine-1-phosphate N-acetyltransferase
MQMIVFEDAQLTQFGPLTQTRPVFELRCGMLSLLERMSRCLAPSSIRTLVRPELVRLCRFLWPGRPVNEPITAGETVVVNGRWLAPYSATAGLYGPEVGMVGDTVAWARVPADEVEGLTNDNLPERLAKWAATLPQRPAEGSMLQYPWDLIELNAAALEDDARHWRSHREVVPPTGLPIQGPTERVLIDPRAHLEPMVFLDTTLGPVMIDRGAIVKAFSRLQGPCYVGPGTQLNAASFRGSSAGPQCRLGGEIEESILHGYSNKAHDGFLGHSYLGEWVNLGAGTQTSDLRNDYGPVEVTLGDHKVKTGRLKIGAYIGDHTKSSIGTLLNTGSVIGPFVMLTAGGLLPKSLPAFSNVRGGTVTERTDTREMFTTARVMMARRQMTWTEAHDDIYLEIYERTSKQRRAVIGASEARRRRAV